LHRRTGAPQSFVIYIASIHYYIGVRRHSSLWLFSLSDRIHHPTPPFAFSLWHGSIYEVLSVNIFTAAGLSNIGKSRRSIFIPTTTTMRRTLRCDLTWGRQSSRGASQGRQNSGPGVTPQTSCPSSNQHESGAHQRKQISTNITLNCRFKICTSQRNTKLRWQTTSECCSKNSEQGREANEGCGIIYLFIKLACLSV
jgi:hypothetical protein